MVSDIDVWWNIIGTYPPMKPYLQYLNITQSNLKFVFPGWRNLLARDPPLEAVLGGNPDLLNKTTALNWFRNAYPMVPTASGLTYLEEDEYKKIHGRFSYEVAPTQPPSIYGGQYIPDSVPVTVEPIAPVATVQTQQDHIVTLTSTTTKIINDITSGVLQIPEWFYHNMEWVKSGQINESAFLTSYHDLVNQHLIHEAFAEPEPEQTWSGWVTKPSGKVEQITLTISTKQTLEGQGWVFSLTEPITEPEPVVEPEIKETWWVIRPSGIIEQLTVTQKFVDTMTAQGWIFSKEKPTIEEPQNQNISIVFYIGKGGDLKTHFGINSIVVTPDEAEQLAGWLYQNYNTKIIFVMNRLTDDIRTHTLQQLKDLIVQKLKDDEPEADDITPDDTKKPKELGFMGAGMAGAIAGLVLLGFIVDHKVGKT